jgi:glycosyltransferase involved in cell wall biosynthesis
MNVVFYYSSHIFDTTGGVQNVMRRLSIFLRKHGINCYLLSEETGTSDQFCINLPSEISINSDENTTFLNDFIETQNITTIVNHDALCPKAVSFIMDIASQNNLKVISVLHNEVFSSNKHAATRKYKFLRMFYLVAFRLVKRSWSRNLIAGSNQIIFFTKANIRAFKEVFPKACLKKAIEQPNPVESQDLDVKQFRNKEKRMLVVARLENNHKNILDVLVIWKEIQRKHGDWSLDILGDGPDKIFLEGYCEKHLIEAVTFHGTKSPHNFYLQSSVFLMTSYFEGFPLTVCEAMSYGVVPILYNSFTAASAMIEDGNNGILVSPYDNEEFSKKLDHLISNQEQLSRLRNSALEKSKEYSLEVVGNKWIELLKNI